MHKHQVRTPEQALEYLTDCTLATVSSMAMLKSRSKSEFERQKAIAQTGIDWLRDFEVEVLPHTRRWEVNQTPTRTVEQWVEQYIK